MSVHDAKLNDLYVDGDGKLWRVIGICGEPTVIAQEVESLAPESPVTKRGGVSGFMWSGWKRVHRPEPKPDRSAYRLDGTQQWQS
jgi:hypothetical protein